jgi:arylsulfatase A-like enzyme
MGKAAAIAQTKPNIVVIMADDLSVGKLNVVLNQGWMPNLKRYIIDKGTTFTNSFVSESRNSI